jgi:hypothetical protein
MRIASWVFCKKRYLGTDERIAGDISQDYFSAPDNCKKAYGTSFRIRRCLTAFSYVDAKGTAPILAHQGRRRTI